MGVNSLRIRILHGPSFSLHYDCPVFPFLPTEILPSDPTYYFFFSVHRSMSPLNVSTSTPPPAKDGSDWPVSLLLDPSLSRRPSLWLLISSLHTYCDSVLHSDPLSCLDSYDLGLTASPSILCLHQRWDGGLRVCNTKQELMQPMQGHVEDQDHGSSSRDSATESEY